MTAEDTMTNKKRYKGREKGETIGERMTKELMKFDCAIVMSQCQKTCFKEWNRIAACLQRKRFWPIVVLEGSI
jgi:hypothetical protein